MRRLGFLVQPVFLSVLSTVPAAAQFNEAPPGITIVAPANGSTRHALNPKIRVEYGWGECFELDPDPEVIDGCDPDPATLRVKINTSWITGWFTTTEWYAENGTGNAGANNFPSNQWSTVYAQICNVYGCSSTTVSTYIAPDPQQSVLLGAHSPNVYDPGACDAVAAAPGAAFACDALVITHGIPGYVSQDAGRSVAVVYSSRSALSQVTVPLHVSLVWDAAATKVEAWMAGQSSTYWNGPDWDGPSGSVSRRVVLSKPESTAVGGYIGRLQPTLTARAHTAAGVYDGTKVDTLPFYFERDSLTTPIARGWGIAGLSRIYAADGHMPGGELTGSESVLLVQGGGGVAYYQYLSTPGGGPISLYGRPAGMFATLVKHDLSNHRWTLTSIEGTRQYYSWVEARGYARLDSIFTILGTTTIAYRDSASGSPATITDPVGKQIRFDYYSGSGVGKLQRICAPAGANERCTTFSYATPGGNTVVSAITDPDGGVDSLFYSGTPHWSAVTGIKPRALGTYTVLYHSGVARPSGVIQPSSSDTLLYLAPALAGAALVGGTSGNPAASAHPDSGWGWVRPPLGPKTYFAADWLGNTTWAKGPDGKRTWTNRNSGGQPLSLWRESQYLRYWQYNGVGALTKFYAANGDTNRITYNSGCNSLTYPCYRTQLVISRAPIVPDTTKWFYSASLLVDSAYKSGFGTTRFWYGSDTRVDSIADPKDHRQRFTYEGTWGNLSATIGDTIKVCAPSCSTVRDSTLFGFGVTGRADTVRHGLTGRKIVYFRDLLARDTMALDSAAGGGSAMTTKTRFNEAARTVTVVDALGRSIVFLSDVRGRTIKQTDAAGARDTFVYDANDRLIKWKTRRGDSLTYAYDSLSRLRTKAVSGTGGGTWTYGYHATYGTLDTLVTPGASVYRVYNTRGWMTEEKSVVNGVTRTVKYAYNQGGGVDTLTDPWNGKYKFGWDVANRARTITNPFSETFSLRHTTDGLLNKIVFPTGADSIAYNADHQVEGAGLNGEVDYKRDPVTKGIGRMGFGGVSQWITYDGFGRLGSDSITADGYGVRKDSFTFDAAGNRTGTGYVYDSTNAVRGRPTISGDSFAPGDSLVYDAAGNPIWWKNKSTGGYDSLTWDAENQLIRLRRYSSGGSLQLDINYAYDGFGRRVKHWGSGVIDHLNVWNGWELLAQTDMSGNATKQFTHHPEGIDFPLAMRESGTTSFFHLDGQGNTYLLTNTSGTRQSEYRYRAWGDRYVTATGEAVQSPFTYKGREEDRETALVYMRNRYYSPRLERFLNEDPIGIGGGLNMFAFVGNDPVNLVDPLGLCPWCTGIPWIPWQPPANKVPMELPTIWAFADAMFPQGSGGGQSGGGGGRRLREVLDAMGDMVFDVLPPPVQLVLVSQGVGPGQDECTQARASLIVMGLTDFAGLNALGKVGVGVLGAAFKGIREPALDLAMTGVRPFYSGRSWAQTEGVQYLSMFGSGTLPSSWADVGMGLIPGVSTYFAGEAVKKACSNGAGS